MTTQTFASVLSACAILAGFAVPLLSSSSSRALGVFGIRRGESSRRRGMGVYGAILATATLIAIVTVLTSTPWWVAPTVALIGGTTAAGAARRVLLKTSTGAVASSSPLALHAAPFGRFVLAYVISLATIFAGTLVWKEIPDALVVHWGAGGNADILAPKGWLTAFAGAWVGLFLTTVLLAAATFSHRRALTPAHESREGFLHEQESVDQWAAQGTFASVAIIFSIPSALLSLLTWIDAAHGVAVVGVMVTMFAALLLTVFGYQIARRGHRSTEARWSNDAGGDDADWIAGLVYVNRQDRAIIVPKRFAVGWTINLGRPAALLFVATVLALLTLQVVLALIQESSG